MNVNALYIKSTKEILYSRSKNDFRTSKDGKCFVDGGFDYFKFGGEFDDFILIELDPIKLLKQILHYDYLYKNNNANDFKDGYCGRFELKEHSNEMFYKELIVKGFKKVWKHHLKKGDI